MGDIFGRYEVSDNVVDIRTLLAPLAPEHVRTVRCLGLNYAKHAAESKMAIPKYPVLFVREFPARRHRWTTQAPLLRTC